MRLDGSIPTQLLLQPSRLAMADVQRKLSQAQIESTTGRHYDVTLVLGQQTGTDIGLRLELTSLDRTLVGAKQAGLKAGIVQSALSAANAMVETFRSTLAGARTSENGRALSSDIARSSLDALQATMGATYDGEYLFGGLNTDVPPLVPYADGPQQAVVNAFQSEFGFPPGDPAAEDLTADQLSDFFEGNYSTLFSEPGWTSTWSNASDERPVFRPEAGESIDVSVTAASPFARNMNKAFAAIDVLGRSKINAVAFQAIVDKSLSMVSTAQIALGDEQSRVGIGQSRLHDVQSALSQTKTALTSAVQALEGVDPYEAATRVNLLMTQLESSYSLTGRISKMSLLSYI